MRFIGDFHIHSHFSIATSKILTPEYLEYWALLKGITVVGSGDFTHPGWIQELKLKLEPAEPGLFRLKDEFKLESTRRFPYQPEGVRFLLTSEISNIYKKNGKVRKVHNLIFSPDFETVEKIQSSLSKLGNIHSDGRPIMGLDSKDLLDIALNSSEKILFVPAHVWTPWFSVLGAKSGFNSIEECFDDFSGQIYGVETGLSSDPPMNWMCSILDRFTLISNSDAHSPEKLGREANLFDTELSYDAIVKAIKTGSPEHFLGTIEFFPQEGKYHYDGHRKCGVCWNPLETLKNDETCPVCGKRITVGVLNRVAQLADRDDPQERKGKAPFFALIPLKELLSEILKTGQGSKKVSSAYSSLVMNAGSEFSLLLDMSVDEIREKGSELLSEAVRRMRNGEVYIKEGYDGEFGRINVFKEEERVLFEPQESLLSKITSPLERKKSVWDTLRFDLGEYRQLREARAETEKPGEVEREEKKEKVDQRSDVFSELNAEQLRAVQHVHGPSIILAGPGTGKTRTLTARIVHLVLNRSIHQESILALTFTNKAAGEIKKRLYRVFQQRGVPQISTFHSFGLSILKEYFHIFERKQNFTIIDREDRVEILHQRMGIERKESIKLSNKISEIKQRVLTEGDITEPDLSGAFRCYEEFLKEHNTFDLDDLIYQPVRIFSLNPEILCRFKERLQWILIDEYQDINFSQYRMIRILMPDQDANLTVIGDPHQAIYGFRGADVRYIQSFLDDYPGASVYKLKRSYRCTDKILKVSGQVIRDDKKSEQFEAESYIEGVRIKISQHPTDKSEAEYVARTIEKMIGGVRFFSIDSEITEGEEEYETQSLSDFAVLCRINRQMDVLLKAFEDHGIPYQVVGVDPLFHQESVKSIIDILKRLVNPDGSFFFTQYNNRKEISSEMLNDFCTMRRTGVKVKEIINRIIVKRFMGDNLKRSNLLKELIDLADDFGDSLEDFLHYVAVGSGMDRYRPEMETVTVMTLHAAKGLEFRCVFIVGCENGLIPYSIFKDKRADPNEERRLLYVGMTRAEKLLFLSHANSRFLFGREFHLERSPYLDNIEEQLIERAEVRFLKRKIDHDTQLDLF